MHFIVGLIIACIGIVVIARAKAGMESAARLSKPWILGQAYVLVVSVTFIGVSFILNAGLADLERLRLLLAAALTTGIAAVVRG
jgi:hypothetical protein